MFRIRRFGIIKTATVVAVMYMLIVAVFVVPFVLLALVVTPTNSNGGALGGVGGLLVGGFAAIVLYGVLGWVFTAIAAAIYNLAAGWVGGIEVQVEPVAPPPPVPAWGTPPTAPPTPPSSTLPPPAEPGPPAPTV